MVVVGYGLIGWILGKVKPAMSWKSGFMLALTPILAGLVGIVRIIWEFASDSPTSNVDLGGFLLFLPVIAAVITAPLASRWGSRSQKTLQGRMTKIIFALFLIAVTIFLVYWLIRVFSSSPNVAPIVPVQEF